MLSGFDKQQAKCQTNKKFLQKKFIYLVQLRHFILTVTTVCNNCINIVKCYAIFVNYTKNNAIL